MLLEGFRNFQKQFIVDYQNIKVIEKVLTGMTYENFEYCN